MADEELHPLLSRVAESIGKLREDVADLAGEVREIPEAIREAVSTIRDAIQENIRAQAELNLIENVMDVRTIKPRIRAEGDQIRSEREDLDDRLERIDERYERKHAEVDQTTRDRIRDLGSHIFEVHEAEFERGIEARFANQVTTAWRQLREHNADISEGRTTEVQETAGEAVRAIREYIDRQDHLIDEIEAHRFDEQDTTLPTDRDEPLQVPYYIVEYEVDGKARQRVVLPSYLSEDDGAWFDASLEPIPGAESVIGEPSDIGREGTRETLDADSITANLDRYQRSSRIGVSFSRAVAGSLPDDDAVPVSVEGGSE
jgi:uncharacterized protein YoxC